MSLTVATDSETALIGLWLNSPAAFALATAMRGEFFENPIYAAAFQSMYNSWGDFSLATVIDDCRHLPDAEQLLYDAWDRMPTDNQSALIDKVIEGYKKRQIGNLIYQIERAMQSGWTYDQAWAEFGPRIEALSSLGATSSRFKPVAAGEIKPVVTDWLIRGMMPAHGLGFIAGAPGAAKTFFAIHAAMSLAVGRTGTFGMKCRRTGVAYIAPEDFEGCQTRIAAWKLRNPNESEPLLHLFDGPMNLTDTACVEDLITGLKSSDAAMRQAGSSLGLIVIDTLAAATAGADENSGKDMSQVLANLQAIGRRTGAFVCAIHHYGKTATAGLRGWSGLTGAADMIVAIEKCEDMPIRIATLSKVKAAKDGAIIAFKLDRVGFGIHDEYGDEADSAVCVMVDKPEPAEKADGRKLQPHLQIMLNAINFVTDNGNTHAPSSDLHHKPFSRAVDYMEVRNRAVRMGFNPGHQDKNINRALEHLISLRKIVMDKESDQLWTI